MWWRWRKTSFAPLGQSTVILHGDQQCKSCGGRLACGFSSSLATVSSQRILVPTHGRKKLRTTMTAHHNPNGRYRNPQPLPTRRSPPVTYLMPVGSYWERGSAVDGGDTSYFNKNRHMMWLFRLPSFSAISYGRMPTFLPSTEPIASSKRRPTLYRVRSQYSSAAFHRIGCKRWAYSWLVFCWKSDFSSQDFVVIHMQK